MIKRSVAITSVTTLLFLLICIFMAGNIYAEQDLELKRDKLDMDKTGIGGSYVTISRKYIDGEYIKSVKPSKQGVVIVSDYDEDFIDVTAVGKGDVVLIVTGSEGTVIRVPVHVGNKGLKNSLKRNTLIDPTYYGDPALYFTTLPGATITVKAGKSKNKKVIPLKKKFINYPQKIKMKKICDIGTIVRITVKRQGVAVTYKRKIRKDKKFLERIDASGKVFKVIFHSKHKGDTIRISYAGRTYTKKVNKTKNYYAMFSIETKKTINKNGTVKVKVYNKYKTVLVNKTCRLEAGAWIRRSPI